MSMRKSLTPFLIGQRILKLTFANLAQQISWLNLAKPIDSNVLTLKCNKVLSNRPVFRFSKEKQHTVED